MPPRPLWLIKDDEIEEKFIKGGRGPGGQKINKSNSKVQLKHIPTGIVVTSQHSRSQEQNRKKAREILALKLEELESPESSRQAMLIKRAQAVKKNKLKKANRKYIQADNEKRLEKEKDAEQLREILDYGATLDIFPDPK